MGIGLGENNIYNRPEGYKGRYPDGQLSMESMTPMIYNVPYDITLRRYIINKQLPLWNKNKGIGTPFAAQGEGSPYFPLNLIRSLLPYKYWNYVTFLGFFIAAVFLFAFLREMTVSEYPSYIGSYMFILSGALGGQITASNITSSLSVTPLLFWASTRAIKLRTPFWRSLFSIIVALQIVAGNIQIEFVILLSVIIFCLYYVWERETSFAAFIRESVVSLWYLFLGIGLALFLLLPIFESLSVAHHNIEIKSVHFVPIFYLLGFIYPLIFGLFRESWFQINWYDLLAYSGQGMIVGIIGGFASCWNNRFHRSMFWFFVSISLFWILRYTGFPFLFIWKIPFLEQLSPKHSNGFIVFCLSISAAFAIENIRNWKISRLITIIVILFTSAVFVFVERVAKIKFDGLHPVLPFIVISIVLSMITLAIFAYARRFSDVSITKAWQVLLVAMSAELMLYIPLGNSSLTFLVLRIFLYIFILFTTLLFIKKGSFLAPKYLPMFPVFYKFSKYYKYLVMVMITMAMGMFIWLIHSPQHGLPKQFDVTVPPKHILWLKERLLSGERTFGIRPDYQTLADIQNIDTNGPFQPYGFANFISLIEGNVTPNEKGYFNNGYFDINLTGYNMSKYVLHKPFFDWIGVKYVILEKSVFEKRKGEYNVLVNLENGLKVCYEDSAATILESPEPTSRAYFSSNYKTYPSGPGSTETIIQFFRNHERYIGQVTLLECPGLKNNIIGEKLVKLERTATQMPVTASRYESNYVQLEVDAPSSGVVVLKDAFYPGWHAYINNTEAPILRANGMVRAVIINRPGKYVVEFRYLPNSFIYGVIVSFSVMFFIIGSILLYYRRVRGNGE